MEAARGNINELIIPENWKTRDRAIQLQLLFAINRYGNKIQL